MKNGDKGVPATTDATAATDGFFNPLDIEIYQNPRTLTNPGFTVEKMRELRNDIVKHGLKQSLEVRIMPDGHARLVAGERRLRSIQQLIKEKKAVYNRKTGKMEPAEKVYKVVPCIITECADDKEAMKHAVLENLLHEHLTDYEILLQCQNLEDSGHSRAEQAEVFGKSEAWVSQSHSLLSPEKCHPKVLEAMAAGILGRTQALKFLDVPHEKVVAVLDKSIAYWKQELADREAKLLSEKEDALTRMELHEAELRVATATQDPEGAADARRAMTEDGRAADQADRKLKKMKAGGKKGSPKPSINNIQDAAEAEGVGQRAPLLAKHIRQMSDQLTKALESGEDIFIDGSDRDEPYNRREVRIIRDICDFILARNEMKSPLEALDVVDDDEQAVAAK